MGRTDDQLIAAVRAGETSAFTELYERHGRALLTFLARLTGDLPLAEDLLQETFIRVWRARDAYEGAGQFRAWLFTIARRLLIDWRRGQRIVWVDEPAALESMAASAGASEGADVRDLVIRLDQALRQLPEGQREVLLLSRQVGLNAGQIARITGSTAVAVRVSLHRALRRLSELLDAPEGWRDSEDA